MKRITKIVSVVIPVLVVLGIAGCSDWTEVSSKYEPESIGTGYAKDEAYYENLRAFKATMLDRKLSWVWFGGWTGIGSYMVNTLEGLPDSLDIVSLWGVDLNELTPERKRDLERVQKVKGTKVIYCQLIGNLSFRDFTPEEIPDEDLLEYWGWEGDIGTGSATSNWEMPTDSQKEVIRKYARCLAEKIIEFGLDGYDIDWEAHDTKGTLASYPERMLVFIDEMSKYFGPLSKTGRILAIDGYIDLLYPKFAPYFDLFVIQAYRASSFDVLDGLTSTSNRFKTSYENFKEYFTPDEFAKKVVMTEEFEKGQNVTGGINFKLPSGEIVNSLKGMAMWNPTYQGVQLERSGGAGVFHVEYEYNLTINNGFPGYYSWMREAIQVMNYPAVK